MQSSRTVNQRTMRPWASDTLPSLTWNPARLRPLSRSPNRRAMRGKMLAPYPVHYEFAGDVCWITTEAGGHKVNKEISLKRKGLVAVRTANLFVLHGRLLELGGIAFEEHTQEQIAFEFLQRNGIRIIDAREQPMEIESFV